VLFFHGCRWLRDIRTGEKTEYVKQLLGLML
jgi:hypothetical protein